MRRIVDLRHVGKEAWCHDCKIPLSFANITREVHMGLPSNFEIGCCKCPAVYRISTEKESAGSFGLNKKLALGNIIQTSSTS